MIPEDYVPFGNEWKAELKRATKDFLIEQLRNSLMKNQESAEAISLDKLAKEKNIVCWMVPITYQDRVEWTFEIEIIPYTKIEEFYRNKSNNGLEGNHFHPYTQWKTYDRAKEQMMFTANKIFEQFIISEK